MDFVLSDESINSYGYVTLTNGIDVEDFKKNPVMLWNHDRDRGPIGKWENLRVKNGKLIGTPVLYKGDDPFINKLQGMLDQGIINAASIGLTILDAVRDESLELARVTKSKLREVSLVDFPANSNAVRVSQDLFYPSFTDEKRFKHLTLSIPKFFNMDLRQELCKLLGLDDQKATITEIVDAVKSLKGSNLKAQENELVELVDKSIKAGKIWPAQREQYLKLGRVDFSTTKEALQGMPEYVPITAQLNQGGKPSGEEEKKAKTDKPKNQWTLSDYRKFAPHELRSNKALYKRLVEQYAQNPE